MSDRDQAKPPSPKASHIFQAPKGTRDFYPEDFARRKYIYDASRATALRHGFDEIDGPTFEHLDLYTVKSGEGIVSELFSFKRFGGEKDFALRPEFTPTLARMVAARANSLPKPIKWFSIANYFRAERPQRGRLREFAQWNCDILGDPSPEADAEVIACCVDACRRLGLGPERVRLRVSDRTVVAQSLVACGVRVDDLDVAFTWIDRRDRISPPEFASGVGSVGLDVQKYDQAIEYIERGVWASSPRFASWIPDQRSLPITIDLSRLESLSKTLDDLDILEWCTLSLSVVRGLAYYTGTVFEVHEAGGKERAIAGGGRYDNLVELFGGPPTPAVGFAMGDVVLSLVLEDKGLIPKGADLMRRIGAAPDVFVLSTGKEESEAALRPLLARLRRGGAPGTPGSAPPSPNPAAPKPAPPLHARRSYKTTRNLGKLLKDAADSGARFALIIESASTATLKDLRTGEQEQDIPCGTDEALASLARRIAAAREDLT